MNDGVLPPDYKLLSFTTATFHTLLILIAATILFSSLLSYPLLFVLSMMNLSKSIDNMGYELMINNL